MNTKAQQKKELREFQDEQQFHEREWAVQRFGWGVLVLFSIGGVSGVFGDGPVAHQSVAGKNSEIEFDRFARRHTATQWSVTYSQIQNTSEPLELTIDADYLRKFQVLAITPEPESTRIADGSAVFQFHIEGASGRVVFHVEPQYPGLLKGSFRLNDFPVLKVSQLIYP